MCMRAPGGSVALTRLTQIVLCVVAAWAGWLTEPAVAGPVGASHDGSVTIDFNPATQTWTVTAADGSIINYEAFSILLDETVNFIQPNELSRVLNRINGGEPTIIAGTMTSNGQVYIVNPAGVMFTGTAVVDAGGVFAAAGNISDTDFEEGVDLFTNMTADVVNEGVIKADVIHLLGRHVRNSGSLISTGNDGGGVGIITMLAGNEIIIQPVGDRVSVKVDGKQLTGQPNAFPGQTAPSMLATPGVENTGTIQNQGGQTILGAGDLYSLAIRNTGEIHGGDGDILLASSDGLIQNDGLIDASNTLGAGGDIVIQGPSVLNRGEIRADTDFGSAGSIVIQGHHHAYFTDSSIVTAMGGDGVVARGGLIEVDSLAGVTAAAEGAYFDVSGGSNSGEGGEILLIGNRLLFNGIAKFGAANGQPVGEILLTSRGDLQVTQFGEDLSFLDQADIAFDQDPNLIGTIRASSFGVMDGAIAVLAGDDLLLGDAGSNFSINLNYDNDAAFTALHDVKVYAPIIGAHDLFIYADITNEKFGVVTLAVDSLSISNRLEVSGDEIIMRGSSIISGGSQEYWGDIKMATDHVLTGSTVTFNDRVNSWHETPSGISAPARLQIVGDAIFRDSVGGIASLQSLDVSGMTTMDGGVIRTIEHQRYQGRVSLMDNAYLISTDGGEIRFFDAVNGAKNLRIDTTGTTRFDAGVGDETELARLTTNAGGETQLNGDLNAQIITIRDQLVLLSDAAINGSTSIELIGEVAGGGHDLALNSPDAWIRGNVADVDTLTTDAAGVTRLGASSIQANRLDFNDPLELTSAVALTASQWIDIAQTIDGPHALQLVAADQVRLGGNIGDNDPLASLEVQAGGTDTLDRNLLLIDGDRIYVLGDIVLNPQGKDGPALVATIVSSGDLELRSENGGISIGPNEKLTALGELLMVAHDGSITVGDLNSMGDMILRSPEIFIRSRDAGEVYAAGGGTLEDEGVDFVSFGDIRFSSTPTILGSGTPVFSARGDFSSTLRDLELTSPDEFGPGDLTDGELVLDLIALPIPDPDPGPPAPEVDETVNLATALDDARDRVRDRVLRDPLALRAAERLGLAVRDLSEEEIRSTTEGRQLLLQQARTGLEPDGAEVLIPVGRVDRQLLLSVLDHYAALFLLTRDPETGEPIEEDQTQYIQSRIAEAYEQYEASGEAEADAAAFRHYLERSQAEPAALAAMNDLRVILAELEGLGLTRYELQRSKRSVLEPIAPSGLAADELEAAITAPSLPPVEAADAGEEAAEDSAAG